MAAMNNNERTIEDIPPNQVLLERAAETRESFYKSIFEILTDAPVSSDVSLGNK